MGSEWCFLLFFCLLVGGLCHVPPIKRSPINYDNGNICKTSGCRCHNVTTMTTVACKFSSTQRVVLTEGSMPEILLNITIHGGDEIIIEPTTFNSSGTFSFLGIYEAKTVVIKQKAFYKIRHVHLRLEIQDCNTLKLTENATKDFKNPFDFHVKNCSQVSVGRHAFSKLLKGEFELIDNLDLAVETFFIENKRIEGTEDTPEAKIYFRNVNISRMQSKTFPTAVNLISITDSSIEEVDSNAFSAMKIIHINFERSRIDHFRSHAFGDQVPIELLKISKCQIKTIESEAIMAAIASFTVEFSHILEIQQRAIYNSSIKTVVITDNQINSLHSNCFTFTNWKIINFNDNILKNVYSHFFNIKKQPNFVEFTFKGNEIYNANPGALNYLPQLTATSGNLKIENNYFDKTCFCDLAKWITELVGTTQIITPIVLKTSFCPLDENFSQCFKSKKGTTGPINMENFTIMVCGDSKTILCKPYEGKTITLGTAKEPFFGNETKEKDGNFILALALGAIFIVAVSGTMLILFIRGGMWLKRRGFCIRYFNSRYRHQVSSESEEEEQAAFVEMEVPEISNQLNLRMLQNLEEQLRDARTCDEARKIIDGLYEKFVDDKRKSRGGENHIYEEINDVIYDEPYYNVKVQKNQPIVDEEALKLLRLLEEKCLQQNKKKLIDSDQEERTTNLNQKVVPRYHTNQVMYSSVPKKRGLNLADTQAGPSRL